MLDKSTVLKTIDEAYAARARGDKAAVAKYWAPNATFRFVGESLAPGFPAGSGDARTSVDSLISLVQFHNQQRLDAVVEGNAAAVHWRVTISTKGGPKHTTELYDLWKFQDDGKALSLTQFGDSALLNRMLGGS